MLTAPSPPSTTFGQKEETWRDDTCRRRKAHELLIYVLGMWSRTVQVTLAEKEESTYVRSKHLSWLGDPSGAPPILWLN